MFIHAFRFAVIVNAGSCFNIPEFPVGFHYSCFTDIKRAAV